MTKATRFIEGLSGRASGAFLFAYVVLAGMLSWPFLRYVPEDWQTNVILSTQLVAVVALIAFLRIGSKATR